MTISERVYRLILKAYPAEYRREYGEPMLQLFRDQLWECGPGRWRVVQLWGRILADTLRGVPEAYWEAPSSSEGGIMRHRTTLAVLFALLFAWFGHRVVSHAFWTIPGTRSFVHAHRPFEWPQSLIYDTGAWTVVESLTAVLAVALFLLILRKFSVVRLSRGALVAVPMVAAGLAGLPFLLVLQPPKLVIHVVWFLPLLLGVVLGAWAANARGREQDEAGPDRSELPIPG